MKLFANKIYNNQNGKSMLDYASIFLKKKELKTRQCVYISQDMHGTVSRITWMFPGREVTVGSYIDNVLKQHFEAHKDEINELYKKELHKDGGKFIIP
jgi:hypothetical protein